MAYKTFANGFPLPASDLNNFLMNQSVIVFADSAARTTAIPSPVEGMLTYLEDTNAYESWNGSAFVNINDNTDAIPKSTVTTAQDLIVADGASSVTRLGVGTDDQVLSVVAGAVAWADAGGGGSAGFTLLSTTTMTGAGSFTITGLSGYSDYMILLDGVSSSAANSNIKIVNWNTVRTGDQHMNWAKDNSSLDSIIAAASTLQLGQIGTNTAHDIYGMVTILGAGDNEIAQVSSVSGSRYSGTNQKSMISQGFINKNSLPLSSFEIELNTGNFDAGNLKVYGR